MKAISLFQFGDFDVMQIADFAERCEVSGILTVGGLSAGQRQRASARICARVDRYQSRRLRMLQVRLQR
jgi:hypothetical protein